MLGVFKRRNLVTSFNTRVYAASSGGEACRLYGVDPGGTASNGAVIEYWRKVYPGKEIKIERYRGNDRLRTVHVYERC